MQYTFLLSVSDPIVQMDLMGALSTSFPKSTVSPLGIIDDLPSQMNLSHYPICVFFSNPIWSNETRDLLLRFVKTGGRLITLGPPKIAELPSAILDMPFTTQMVLDVLSSGEIAQPAPQPAIQT